MDEAFVISLIFLIYCTLVNREKIILIFRCINYISIKYFRVNFRVLKFLFDCRRKFEKSKFLKIISQNDSFRQESYNSSAIHELFTYNSNCYYRKAFFAFELPRLISQITTPSLIYTKIHIPCRLQVAVRSPIVSQVQLDICSKNQLNEWSSCLVEFLFVESLIF